MPLRTTRRTLLGIGLGAGSLVSLESRRERGAAARQESGKLAIAILDEHWEILEPLVEAYGEMHEIDIDTTPLSVADLYGQLSLTLTQRADTYDVVFLDDPWIPQFATFLTTLDIASDAAATFMPIAMQVGQFPSDARPSALPVLGEVQFFGYWPAWLKSHQQSLPATWDETVEVASTIAAELDPDEDRAAFAMRTLTSYQITESFAPILRGYGKTLIDIETSVPQLDTPESLAALETFLTLASFSPEESAAEGEPSNAERFEMGEISMMSNFWSSDLLAARTLTPEQTTGPLASTLQPAQASASHQAMTGIWLAGIPVGSQEPERARDFLDWLTSVEFQAQLPGLSLPPVRIDVFDDGGLIESCPDLPVLKEMLAVATPRPRSPFYPQLEQLLASELAKALSGESSGAEAMKNANIAIREFLVREGVLGA